MTTPNAETEQAPTRSVGCEAALLVVYSVLHTDCIYESAYRTVSLHRTKRGVVEAMKKLKASVFYDEGFYEHHGFRYGKQAIQE